MNTRIQGGMLASLVVALDSADIGASLVEQKDRRGAADRRRGTRGGGRRVVDGVTSVRPADTVCMLDASR
jgi:hypothetical protein